MKNRAGHFECTPDPTRARICLLDAYLENSIMLIEGDRIESLRAINGKQKKGQLVIRQLGQRGFRKPHRVGKTNGNRFVG